MQNYQLTKQESIIWQTLSKGLLYKEISKELDIPVGKIPILLKSIYRKLSVRNRTDAAIKFLNEQDPLSN